MIQAERPVYRHVVVQRRGYIERVASPDDLRRLRQQVELDSPIDDDLKHLFVQDTLKKTMKVMGWSGYGDVKVEADVDGLDPAMAASEAQAMKERGGERTPVKYRPQEGYIVARVNTKHVPGGDESLPIEPTMLHHPGFGQADNAEVQYLECARQLQTTFQEFSDRKFLLMDPVMQAGGTLGNLCI